MTALEARIPNFAQIPFLLMVHFTPSDDLVLKGAKQVWMGAAPGPLSRTDPNGLLRCGTDMEWTPAGWG